MPELKQAIHVAYSVSNKNGRLYHARAYCEEHGFPGLPGNHVFKTCGYVGNDSDSADAACRAAIAALVEDRPEFKSVHVFQFGRQSDAIVSAAPVIGFHGRNACIGVASECARAL